MAVTYTNSVASGYSTNTLYYDEGPLHVFTGTTRPRAMPRASSRLGCINIKNYYVQDADVTTFVQSANANGTLALIFSGMVTGATGYFEIKGH